ncbi:MAG: PAS domain S-box protein [Promethearchaeota archaeon]|jgi:PAS domain S-box-containing protein
MKYNREEIEEKYKDLFEYSLDLIYVSDLRGKFLDANDIALEMLGYKREEIPNISFIDLIDKDEMIKAFEVIKEIKDTGKQSTRRQYKLKTKYDKVIFVETFAIPLRKNNKIYAILGIGNDITETKLAEQKLIESEEKYRHLFQNSPYFVGLVDLQGVLIDCNDVINRLLSVHKKEDIIGKNFREIFAINEKNNSVIPLFMTLYKNIIQANATEPIEFKLNRTVGDFLWLNLRGSLIKIEKKSVIQFIIQDITEKKKAEQKLRDSEEKYRYLFEDSPFSIILLNNKGIIIDCNPATEKLLGDYEKKDLIGIPFMELRIIPQEFLLTLIELFKKFIKGEQLHRIDIRLYKRDGSLIWANLQASLVKVGGETFVQVILHDITKRKEAEFLINQEVQKLKELDQLRKDLISRVSHELKTPLVSVFASSEYLLSEYQEKLEVDVLELIQMIQKGGNRLKHLVDNLLDITRIEYDNFNLQTETVNLSELILECSEEMKYLVSGRNLNIDLNLPERLFLEIDRIRIQQVITNILLNAIKNTPPLGKISINLEKNRNWIEIKIRDTGVGLTKEELNVLFTRFGKFERIEEGLEYIDIQGSGLGLFISNEIVKLHGGSISAESDGRHRGSIFTVKFPIN